MMNGKKLEELGGGNVMGGGLIMTKEEVRKFKATEALASLIKESARRGNGELEESLMRALEALLFRDDFEEVSRTIIYNLYRHLFHGCAVWRYPPDLIASLMSTKELINYLADFLVLSDAKFEAIADRVIDEFGEKAFCESLIRGLSHFDIIYSLYNLYEIYKYLSKEEIAQVIYDRIEDEDRSLIEIICDVEDENDEMRGILHEVAVETGRMKEYKKIFFEFTDE